MKRYVVSSLIVCATLVTTLHAQPAATAPTMGVKDAYAGKFLIGAAGDVPRGYSAAELANIKANYNIITPENSMKPQNTHPSENGYNWATPDALVQWCLENNIKVWGHTLAWHAQTANWFFQGTNGQPVTRELAMERLKSHIFAEVGRYKGRVTGWDVVNEAINDGGNGATENIRNSSWVRAIGPDYLTMAFKWAHEADPDAQLYYNDYNIEQGAVANTGKHASSMLLLKRLIAEGAPINGVGIQGHWHLDTNIKDVEKAIENYESLGLKISISELDVTATGNNSGALNAGGAAGGARGGALTADQTTQLDAAFTAAQADLTSLQDKLNAAQKDAVNAVLNKSDDATVRSKLEAVANIQSEISMLRYTKGVSKVAPTLTADQKSTVSASPDQTYYTFFGGTPPQRGGRGGRGGGRGAAQAINPENYKLQAEVYAKLFDIFNRHAKSISRVTFWGISDSRTWRGGQDPLLFDGQLNPKPALQAVLDVGTGKYVAPKP